MIFQNEKVEANFCKLFFISALPEAKKFFYDRAGIKFRKSIQMDRLLLSTDYFILVE